MKGGILVEPWYKIDKKIKNKNYSSKDLLSYLSHSNDAVLYNTLHEIAKEKIYDEDIIEKITKIALGEDPASQKGFIVTSIRIVAIATLKELGITSIFESLDENEKNAVKGAFS